MVGKLLRVSNENERCKSQLHTKHVFVSKLCTGICIETLYSVS